MPTYSYGRRRLLHQIAIFQVSFVTGKTTFLYPLYKLKAALSRE